MIKIIGNGWKAPSSWKLLKFKNVVTYSYIIKYINSKLLPFGSECMKKIETYCWHAATNWYC